MEKVVAAWEAEGKKITSIKRAKLYVKPEEGKAYYVVNEGLKNGSTGFFIDCFPQPIFGNGLVLGVDLKNGASRSTTLELQQLAAHINFCILVQTPSENVILKM